MTLYFEDLHPGRLFTTPAIDVDPAEVHAFATRYDPQPFHLDAAAGAASAFGALVASGWQTAALTMRLLVGSELSTMANGLMGLQVDKMVWHQPVRPGDRLRAEFEVLERKRSRSKPGFGVVKLAWRSFNQAGSLVMSLENTIWAAAREPFDTSADTSADTSSDTSSGA